MSEYEQFANKIIQIFFNDVDEIDLNIIRDELVQRYKRGKKYLDSKFFNEIIKSNSRDILSTRFWEAIVLGYLLKHTDISIEPHSNKGPDWSIELKNGKKYCIEATYACIPGNANNSEIHRVTNELKETGRSTSSGDKRIAEAKSRISNRISEKINKHKSLMQNENADYGYILAISYGGLPFFVTCDLYQAIQTVYPFGNMRINSIDDGSVICKQLEFEDSYIKPSTGKPIYTNIFPCERWISAVLFSKVESLLLLDATKTLTLRGIEWSDRKNDFVLFKNPFATHPLDIDLFESNTVITVIGELVVDGENIFPCF